MQIAAMSLKPSLAPRTCPRSQRRHGGPHGLGTQRRHAAAVRSGGTQQRHVAAARSGGAQQRHAVAARSSGTQQRHAAAARGSGAQQRHAAAEGQWTPVALKGTRGWHPRVGGAPVQSGPSRPGVHGSPAPETGIPGWARVPTGSPRPCQERGRSARRSRGTHARPISRWGGRKWSAAREPEVG